MDILEEEMEEIIASPAAQVIVAIIPIVGIVIGGVVVFFYLLWFISFSLFAACGFVRNPLRNPGLPFPSEESPKD